MGVSAIPIDPTPIVYTRIFFSFANPAAVSGERVPELLLPSVSNMITLDFVSFFLKRFTAVPSPVPIAVPPSRFPG